MAHEITATDGLMLAGQRAWHGLGTVLPERTDAMTALEVAKLDWKVEVAPIVAQLADGRQVEGGEHCAVVRSDTGEMFATCKSGYTPIQNRDIAELAMEVSQQSQRAVESAGSVRGGRRVWILLDMGTIFAASDDKIKPYLFIGAGHDRKMALTIGCIATRVVCANTFAIALSEMSTESLKIRHNASASERMAEVRHWLETPTSIFRGYGEKVVQLAETPITDEQLQAYFTSVWQRINGPLTSDDIANEKSRRANNYAKEVGMWLRNFRDDKRQTGVSTSGTIWSALNSVTQWAQHEQTIRKESTGDNLRTNSVLFGSAADINKPAHDAAFALIA